MNITFFVGNGFDINIGLKTRYSDFYPFFIENASDTNMIRQWLQKDELLWADLEEKLGEKSENVNENNLEKFYKDKMELEELLLEYLEKEEHRISSQIDEAKVADEFTRSISKYYTTLTLNEIDSIKATCKTYGSESVRYCFICFNYTEILDKIVNITCKLRMPFSTHRYASTNVQDYLTEEVLHIHGTLEREGILGVNDVDQINNPLLRNNTEFLDVFIKKRANENIGQRKTERALDLIKDSHIICIFGMSMGNTDRFWWEEIVKWLSSSSHNKLVIFVKDYEENLKRNLSTAIIRLKNKQKKEVLIKGGIDEDSSEFEELKKRVFIVINCDIFNFKDLILDKCE